jgi:hypothetical protein
MHGMPVSFQCNQLKTARIESESKANDSMRRADRAKVSSSLQVKLVSFQLCNGTAMQFDS